MITLVPHPDHPPRAVQSVKVKVERLRHGFALQYFLHGDTARIVIPSPVHSRRGSELWTDTCFEAFVRSEGPAYCEFNFSPSTEWASYAFDDYREGMRDTPTRAQVHTEVRPNLLAVSVMLHADFSRSSKMCLSAVVCETDGTKSYWAIRHRDGPPDFHHPDCFARQLP